MSYYDDVSLFDGIEYFFDAIKEKCSSDEEYATELLKARGFLLEDEGLILSDNSRKDDFVYLNELLTSENIGEVQDNKITIFPKANVEKIFYKDTQIGGEAWCFGHSWKQFIHYKHAKKIWIGFLEPFVARYVKSISACGVQTWCSCDGNHSTSKNFQKIFVKFEGYPYQIWNKIICEKLLVKNFNLKWNEKYSEIEFKKVDKWKTYVEVNRVAEFLYNNRQKIRQIRREVSNEIRKEMSWTMINKMNFEELTKIFSEKANKLFDEYFKDI